MLEWYDALFRDERMREIDPFGYGMGLAIGYVLIPAVLLFLASIVVWEVVVWARRRSSS